jgi:nitrite reductase/ring-hydroxylating ferredoxin subunit
MRTVLSKLERAGQLDRLSDRIQGIVQAALPRQWMRDFLHGVWLGHPLHPALVDVPLGAWTSSAILDLMPGQRRAATTLVAVGTTSAVPTIVAGWNDWASLSPAQRRVGLIHAASNATAVALYGGSLAARLTGRHRLGQMLGWAGLSMATGGAYLGGHLAYKMGAAVNQAVPELHRVDDGWHQVGRVAELPHATLVTKKVNEVPVAVYRDGNRITALLEHCAHQGGPLSEGDITQVDGHVCVVCPWHGSTYRLDDGEVVHGPAGTDQQTLPTRVMADMLEVRLPD